VALETLALVALLVVAGGHRRGGAMARLTLSETPQVMPDRPCLAVHALPYHASAVCPRWVRARQPIGQCCRWQAESPAWSRFGKILVLVGEASRYGNPRPAPPASGLRRERPPTPLGL
jgi:hypothetical protein